MTSMPADRSSWEKKLALVEESYNDAQLKRDEHIYLLVLEDPDTGEIVGSCGIHAGVGRGKPFYNYRLSKHVKTSEVLGITVTSTTLNLGNDFTGETELISLYLKPEYRRNKLGQCLSRARFMLLHDFPERFGNTVFAELRGWLDPQGNSPFWDSVGNKFFKIPFDKADFISAVDGYQFISDLMPKLPIYLDLLPQAAIEAVGKPNDETRPAMRLLEKEGFTFQGSVDIFDAGPVVQCPRNYIRAIEDVERVTLETTFADGAPPLALAGVDCIVSYGALANYRISPTTVYRTESGIQISQQSAARLQAEVGATVQILELRK
jgi:arginine N-succinyltransferase